MVPRASLVFSRSRWLARPVEKYMLTVGKDGDVFHYFGQNNNFYSLLVLLLLAW